MTALEKTNEASLSPTANKEKQLMACCYRTFLTLLKMEGEMKTRTSAITGDS